VLIKIKNKIMSNRLIGLAVACAAIPAVLIAHPVENKDLTGVWELKVRPHDAARTLKGRETSEKCDPWRRDRGQRSVPHGKKLPSPKRSSIVAYQRNDLLQSAMTAEKPKQVDREKKHEKADLGKILHPRRR
jgi:hypothetical protein